MSPRTAVIDLLQKILELARMGEDALLQSQLSSRGGFYTQENQTDAWSQGESPASLSNIRYFPAVTSRWSCRVPEPGRRLDLNLKWAGCSPGRRQVSTEKLRRRA